MKANLLKIANYTTLVLAGFVAFVLPLLFTTTLGEAILLPKQLVLYAVIALLIVVTAVRYFGEGVRFRVDSLTVPLFLLAAFAFAGSYFGASRLTSLIGGLPQFIGIILFYFLLMQNLPAQAGAGLPAASDKKSATHLLYAVLASVALLAAWRILNFFELYLPLVSTLVKVRAFTPVGSGTSLTVLLSMLLPLNLALLMRGAAETAAAGELTLAAEAVKNKGNATKWLRIAALSLSLLLIGTALILTAPAFALYLVSFAVLLTLIYTPAAALKKMKVVLLGLSLVLLLIIVAFHVPFTANKGLLDKTASFPKEIQLDLRTSWVVAVHAVRDFPFFGSGLNTFLADFSHYRPVAYNASPYWNVRFGTAGNGVLQMLATLGLLGFLAFVYLVVKVLKIVRGEYLARTDPDTDERVLKVGLGVTLLTYLVSLLLTVPNFTVDVVFFTLLAVSLSLFSKSIKSLSPSIPMEDGRDALPYLTVGPAILLATAILYFAGRFAYADYTFRQGINEAVAQKTQDSFNTLRNAVQINPYRDSYHLSLASLTFSLADSIAAKGKEMTKDDQTTLLQLLDFSIKEAKNAVTIDPSNVDNWYNLASLYRNVAGLIQNAGDWAVATYQQAILLDPVNPVLRMDLGGLFYLAGDYESAANYFREAVSLKQDLANAHFNLAYAYRQKNMIPAAYNEMAYVTRLVTADSPDYKRAFDDLETLRKLLPADAQAQLPTSVAPGAELTPTPELNIATPSATLAKPQPQVEKINLPEASPATQPLQ